MVCMAITATVRRGVAQMRAAGLRVDADWRAGTVRGWDGQTVVYSAIQKGRRGPWVVRLANSERITWTDNPVPLG